MSKNKRKQVVPEDETKEAKFIRVVTPRINRAVKVISLIGNCAGAGYVYSVEQHTQIIEVLEKAVEALDAKFSRTKQETTKFGFTS